MRPFEIVIGFNGKFSYSIDSNIVFIAQICVQTKEGTFRPYGGAINVTNVNDFFSPMCVDCPVVGVFGRCDRYLESLGVILWYYN